MDNEEANTPVITSLVVGNELPDPHRPKPTPPWHTSFSELLRLLMVIDSSKPIPKIEDQRFCFQPSPDLSEISRVFLSVTTPNLQYDIDLKAICVAGSDAVPLAVNELQEYANNVLRRNREFRNRLFQHDLITNPNCSPDADLFTCPSCFGPLIGCLECDAKVACCNDSCLGSVVASCEQCSMHKRVVCFDCLKRNDMVPPLIYCRTCDTWCCREDALWCAGLVIQPTLGSDELAQLSRECDWDNEMIVRSHPPKPGSCRYCADHGLLWGWATCRNSVNDMKPDRCPSQTPFMTYHDLLAAHCPDCLKVSSGHHCACGVSWLCGMCFAVGNNRSDGHPSFVTCPGCGVHYCTCGSIDYCKTCGDAILCANCQEEDQPPAVTQTLPKQVVLTKRCGFCKAWSCDHCSSLEGTAKCFHCNQRFCHDCVTQPGRDVLRACPSCHGPVCRQCGSNNRACSMMSLVMVMMPPYPSNF